MPASIIGKTHFAIKDTFYRQPSAAEQNPLVGKIRKLR